MKNLCIFSLMSVLILSFINSYGEIEFEEQKLSASDGASYDKFGHSVSLYGDHALIGGHYDDDNGTDSGSAYIFELIGGQWFEKQKLLVSDGAAGDHFGESVSLYGDRALIGAYHDDDNGTDSGSVYIFELIDGQWVQQQKLLASDGAEGDYFGHFVSLYGDRALIGTPRDDDNGDKSGSAYIFELIGGQWVQQQKLLASDGAKGDYFGRLVSLYGDRALIGARGNGDKSGSAYIFELIDGQWVEKQKLLASDGTTGDHFGRSVSLYGDRALIGARFDDDNGDDSGSAYIFELVDGQWVEKQKLLASDGASGDWFGHLVSLYGDRALIGARFNDDNGDDSGSAYIFELVDGQWLEKQKLLASDGTTGDHFGRSVSLYGDRALIGARFDDDNGDDSGSAYIFELVDGQWVEKQKLLASDGASGDWFGHLVSLYGDRALIGARFNDDNGDDSGSAYIFELVDGQWVEKQKLLASDGAAGDDFGHSVSLYGNRALINARSDDDNGKNSGSAYIFVDRSVVTHFIQVSKSVGISRKPKIAWGNPIWGDINNDNFLDLIVPTHQRTPNIYLNQGNGTFVRQKATNTFFPKFPEEYHDRHGFSFTDFDNDGNLDLYITLGAEEGKPGFTKKDFLYWGNGDGTFNNIATEAGVENPTGRGRSGCWFDYDNDGSLDLLVKNKLTENHLYLNNGSSFTDIAAEVGLADVLGRICSIVDYNNDGKLDIFISEGKKKYTSMLLLRHEENGTFTDVTSAANIVPKKYARGAAWGDFNNDGHIDLYIAVGSHRPVASKKNLRNLLYLNNGDSSFTEVTNFAGVDAGNHSTWAAVWGDINNDGWLDLFVTNLGQNFGKHNKNFLYLNQGDGTFVDIATQAGIQGYGDDEYQYLGAAMGDYDDDGFLDIVLKRGYHDIRGSTELYHNEGNSNNFLKVKLEGTSSNRLGIGSMVKLTTSLGTQYRQYTGTSGGTLYSQSAQPLHFGLGSATTATLEIVWPNGLIQEIHDISVNRLLKVTQP
jgi:esterase/lipase superfamily enzyme